MKERLKEMGRLRVEEARQRKLVSIELEGEHQQQRPVEAFPRSALTSSMFMNDWSFHLRNAMTLRHRLNEADQLAFLTTSADDLM